jgi:hypothetical protein
MPAHDAAELVERLLPIARESGDDRHLAAFKALEKLRERVGATAARVSRSRKLEGPD